LNPGAIGSVETLFCGRLPRFQFAGMNVTTPIDGGLGTVKWIQNIGPCRPQSRPTKNYCVFELVWIRQSVGRGWKRSNWKLRLNLSASNPPRSNHRFAICGRVRLVCPQNRVLFCRLNLAGWRGLIATETLTFSP